jgi:hypothetical protein
MSRKDVEKALKLCGSPMTYSQFYKKLKLTKEQQKAKANACVHFLTNVPNSKEGWAFINQMKKYLHKGRYSIRLKGRGSRKEHGNQSFVPIPHAEKYSIYIDQKIKDRNHPDFLHTKMWKMRSKLYNLRSEIDELLK